jgi:hypothetical protein
MRRLLVCLPLCLLLAPDGPRDLQRAAPLLAAVADDGGALPSQEQMKRLAETDPIAFLRAAIRRYDREVKGYHCILHKQERLEGTLQPSETIACDFREDPFSVLMDWQDGARLAKRTLYVKGENKDMILVKPAGLLALAGVVERDPAGSDAKKSSRYPINEFGIKIGMARALASWEAAQKQNALHVEYLGEVKPKEIGGRPCWKIHRKDYKNPEDDGITDSVFYYDEETWLQAGSTVKGPDGKLLGEYWFRDIELNPDFKSDPFTREAVAR